ncbi:MAG: hypothetical protein R2737_15725 [Candidatus Nanopelagicales bacterium]
MSTLEVPEALVKDVPAPPRRSARARGVAGAEQANVTVVLPAGHSPVVATALRVVVADALEHEARLARVADEAGLEVGELLGLVEGALASRRSAFTEAEVDALAEAGISADGPEGDPAGMRALLAGRLQEHALVTQGLSVEDAGALLGVTAARVRQRIDSGELVAIRSKGGYALPRWQFVADRVVPGLDRITAQAAGLHPLELAGFMTNPNVDLAIDGTPVSPVDWLVSGGDPEPVADLVHSLVRA